jgi:hypothetical protein
MPRELETTPQPLAFGYLQGAHRTPAEVVQARVSIAARAQAEGFTLKDVYVEPAINTRVVFNQMLAMVRFARNNDDDPRAIIVPQADDIGSNQFWQFWFRERIEHREQLQIFVIQ